jgi:hypothetical protein
MGRPFVLPVHQCSERRKKLDQDAGSYRCELHEAKQAIPHDENMQLRMKRNGLLSLLSGTVAATLPAEHATLFRHASTAQGFSKHEHAYVLW